MGICWEVIYLILHRLGVHPICDANRGRRPEAKSVRRSDPMDLSDRTTRAADRRASLLLMQNSHICFTYAEC